MDTILDPAIEKIVIMAATQLLKTEMLLNTIGYFIHQDPAPILAVLPTIKIAETFSKDRLAPMIRDTFSLRSQIKDSRARDSHNTVLHKKFPGGHITMAGANSPSSLAMRPIRVLICDEIDRYPTSAGVEGDPINLAEKRTATFYNKKIILASSPTIKDASRIQFAYDKSDKRVYLVPCPECKHYQTLEWSGLKWDKVDDVHKPETVEYCCKKCGSLIPESRKSKMIERGRWKKTSSHHNTAGFWINELYSPWRTWEDIVRDFLDSKDSPEKFKTFVNTTLAETFEIRGEAPPWKRLYARRENYQKNLIPKGGLLLVAGVDVQQDRIEVELIAYGRNRESWSVDYRILTGSTDETEVWENLRLIFDEVFTIEGGGQVKLRFMAVDSGFRTMEVYSFGRLMGQTRVMVVKGQQSLSQPISRPKPVDINLKGRKIRQGVHLYNIGVDIIKHETYAYLRLERDGDNYPAGYLHFPDYDEEFFKQLTAEEVIRHKTKAGFYRYEFKKTRERNEALDCRVYGRAASIALGMDLWTDQHWEAIEKEVMRIGTEPAKKPRKKVHSKGIKI